MKEEIKKFLENFNDYFGNTLKNKVYGVFNQPTI